MDALHPRRSCAITIFGTRWQSMKGKGKARLPFVTVGRGDIVASFALLGFVACAHPQRAESQPRAEADFPVHAVQVRDFIRTIPLCDEGQKALSVETALKETFTPGECMQIEGRLVLDAAPLACATDMSPSNVCAAQWMLIGQRPPEVWSRLPGVRRYRQDEHTLFVHNDRHFDKPKRDCEEDDGGNPRMPRGTWFRLPDAYRERVLPPAGDELPSVRVIVLGEIYDHCRDYPADRYGQELCAELYASKIGLTDPWGWFDMARICVVDRVAAPTPDGTAPAR